MYKNLSASEIARRKPVWTALSGLWLDTKLEAGDLDQIVVILRRSDYTLAELKDIYLYEVGPVLYPNLLSPAGVWNGFNEQWLHDRILHHLQSWNKWKAFKYHLIRPLITYGTLQYWKVIEKNPLTDP